MKMILGWANLAWLFTSLVFQIILIRFVCSYKKENQTSGLKLVMCL